MRDLNMGTFKHDFLSKYAILSISWARPSKFTLALGKYQMGGGNKSWSGFSTLLSEIGSPIKYAVCSFFVKNSGDITFNCFVSLAVIEILVSRCCQIFLFSWLPTPNAIAERSTGKTMGFHACLMAELNKISRMSLLLTTMVVRLFVGLKIFGVFYYLFY